MPKNIKIDGGVETGKPKDWIESLDGPCDTISVSSQVDEVTGIPFLVTAWQFSPEELKQLQSGKSLFFLAISGMQHPVIKLFVHDGQDEKETTTYGSPDG